MANSEPLDWESFEIGIEKLRKEYGNKLRFRGQADSRWDLSTTLERSGGEGMSLIEYYRLICTSIGPEVAAYSATDVPQWDRETQDALKDRELFRLRQFPRNFYRYMAYLRHHGFPSPLLDWTRSPYIAAYFAFRDRARSDVPSCSIFTYCEMPEGHKGGAVGEPGIHLLGPYVQAHHRHFRQQCDYTLCASKVSGEWAFGSHESVFRNARPGQDYRWRFDLHSSERNKVLKLLGDYNLNSFSLFGTEESLLESLWFREYSSKQASMAAKLTG